MVAPFNLVYSWLYHCLIKRKLHSNVLVDVMIIMHLLEMDIYDRITIILYASNLQILMTEVYKCMNHVNPSLVWEFHQKKHVTYDIRIQNHCKLPQLKTQGYGQDPLSFRGSFLWNTLDAPS